MIMISLLSEACTKMGPEAFEIIKINMQSLRGETPSTVQEENAQLRADIELLMDCIGTEEDTQRQSEKESKMNPNRGVPDNSFTGVSYKPIIGGIAGKQQPCSIPKRAVRSYLFSPPSDVVSNNIAPEDQVHLQLIAKDIHELKELAMNAFEDRQKNFIDSNMKAMPRLPKQVSDVLGSLDATNKELIELLKPKTHTQIPGDVASAGSGVDPRARVEPGPFQFGNHNTVSAAPARFTFGDITQPSFGASSAPNAAAPGAAAGSSEQEPSKDDQIANLEMQLHRLRRLKEDNYEQFKNTQHEAAKTLHKIIREKDKEINQKNIQLTRKDLDISFKNGEIARMNAQVLSKDNEIKRLQDELKVKTREQPIPVGLLGSSKHVTGASSSSDSGIFGTTACPPGKQPASGSLFGSGKAVGESVFYNPKTGFSLGPPKDPAPGLSSSAARHSEPLPTSGPLFGARKKPGYGSLFAHVESSYVSPCDNDIFYQHRGQATFAQLLFGSTWKPSTGSSFATHGGLFSHVARPSDGQYTPGSVLGSAEYRDSEPFLTTGRALYNSLSHPPAAHRPFSITDSTTWHLPSTGGGSRLYGGFIPNRANHRERHEDVDLGHQNPRTAQAESGESDENEL
ncbi:uncharacterized protein N0V89_010356 [Didymosphaeria variabile]|uniref:Uncharacterized protein n=1 Tax=Didymosphaeria variabile TaxID=1932322 RepID=A0A9W8XCQ4_9PLEO|nr:uncharacterized protein N0V89_010356 [Didymosphaeria variabile]KAJ4346427.1 hypothetical protein N0V89_010356 [Didymosphaeria variabile]